MYKSFGIHVKVKNIEKSYTFYKKLGFREIFAYGKKSFLTKLEKKTPKVDEKYNGVTFQLGDTKFEIADGHLAVKPETFKKKILSSKISAMIFVESVEDILKICKKNSIKVSVPIKEYHWGTKELVLKDPDGFVLVFIENI
ncbi:MAG: VOC family protein [Patescibacteria group bacterium]|nr:VOC family protein [Patescibacteria group bacterium]